MRTSQWLSDLQIYDYRNRMYQPEMGRFLQPDPFHFGAGDYNLYRYCHNDPVNCTDPDGEVGWPGAGYGAIAGAVSEIVFQGAENWLNDKSFFQELNYNSIAGSGLIGAGTGAIGYGVLTQTGRGYAASKRLFHVRKVLADRKAAEAAGKFPNAEKTANLQREAQEAAKAAAAAAARGASGPLIKRAAEEMVLDEEDRMEKKENN